MTRSGFVALVGRPNTGKSTLLNSIIGEKVAIVSYRSQTTRNRIVGILTQGDDQIVFTDTPGIHTPRTDLGKYMVDAAKGNMNLIEAGHFYTEFPVCFTMEKMLSDIDSGIKTEIYYSNRIMAI